VIHKLKSPDGEFLIHNFSFNYMTDHADGLPAQHGSMGFLDVVIHLDSQDSDGSNFKLARNVFWSYTVAAPQETQKNLRREWTLTAKQAGNLSGGERTLKFEGWVSSYTEFVETGSAAAGPDGLRVRIVVRPKTEGYQPELA